jgi:molybdate transport system permease protein
LDAPAIAAAVAVGSALMALEVQIEKKLPDFALEVSFRAEAEPLSILGASGAGKTMLLRCIAGLERPDRGRIKLNDRVFFDSESHLNIPARQRRIGLLFQSYALFPHRTVAENIAFGLEGLPRDERSKKVAALVERTHLPGLEGRNPRTLSGGEQQRVALARALAIEPEALLLDEPLSALDTHLRSQMEIQLQETFAVYLRPTLLVTHNMEEAYRLGARLLVLSRGRVVASGAKQRIFQRPPSVEVARLTGCKNISRARAISDHSVEALDWGCTVRVAQPGGQFAGHSIAQAAAQSTAQATGFVGIRAHHIEFVEANGASSEENVFPCWLVQSSETPFRVTLFLTLQQHSSPSPRPEAAQLQAEVYKEKWQRFRDKPFPWHVRLPSGSLFWMKE